MTEAATPAGAPRPWWDLPADRAGRLALAFLFLATIPMLTKIFTSDFGTHIALGKHIVEKHDIPTREHWNYPSLGMENGSGGEWGFQALLYLVHSAGGEYGVSFLVWAVVAGIFFFLYRATVLRGAHPLLAVLAIFAFSGFLRIRIQPRPEIFTYLFTSATIYLLTEYYYGARKRWIYALPAMILVWANMHPTYLMAFVLCGAFFADALARAAWRREFRREALRGWIVPPLAAGLAGLLLSGLNPHGYGWLLAPLHLISRGEGTGHSNVLISISELTPVKGTGFYAYYKAAAVFAAVSLVLGAVGRRVYLLDLFLLAIAFKGAYDSARAVSMMGLFLSPGAAVQLTGFLERAMGWFAPKAVVPSKTAGKDRGRGKERGKAGNAGSRPGPNPAPYRSRITAGFVAVAAAVSIALAGFGGTTVSFSFSQLEFGVGITRHKFSFEAAEFLRRNPIPGKMFNFFDIGGFLDWQVYPQAMTFIDGRAYNPKVFQEHQMVTGAFPEWKEIVDRYGFSYFVLKSMDSSGTILPIVPALANDPGWSLVFSDGLFLIFVRNTPELRDYVRRHEISKAILPQHIIREARHYMFLGVSPIVAYSTMSNMYLVMGRRAEAIDVLREGIVVTDDPFLRGRLMQLERGAAPR